MFGQVRPARRIRQRITAPLVAALALLGAATPGDATIVRFNTVSGNVFVRLYDTATPLSTANFLQYVTSLRYNGTFIHRVEPGFVVQGGGYTYDAQENSAPHIQQFAQVQNEPGVSNLRGTIAMAKLADPSEGGPPNGGPNSATSEWFFNLSDDNAGSCPLGLDCQNGGFTVFGRVLANTMTVVDAIAALPLSDLDGPGQTFDKVPLRNGTGLANQLVFVNSIQVLNLSPGDYDLNGPVNLFDYNVWRKSFGSTTEAGGDGNGNAIIDTADYVVWRKAAGVIGTVGMESSGGVPEPGTALLLSFAGLWPAGSRRLAAFRRL